MKYIYLTFFSLLFILFFTQCANIVPPTGGPVDSEAPIWNKESSVPNNSNRTNYTKEYVELTFDERVQVASYQTELYTTPSLDINKIKVVASKNTVRLNFNQELEENTTYTINFGKCIKDVTEGNVVENIQVAFSTGDKIDSLSISGNVIDHLTNQPITKALVGLYSKTDTSKLFSKKPKYYTQTDASGNFKLNYLKTGLYEIISITDKNQNFKYDLNKEKIGFLSSPIQLDSAINNISLKMILEPDTLFKIITISPRDNYYQIKTNKGIFEDKTNYPDSFIKVKTEDKFIQLFDIGTREDSATINFIFIDSLGTKIDSTTTIKVNRENGLKTALKKTFYFDRKRDTTFFVMEMIEPIKEMLDSTQLMKLRDSTYLDNKLIEYNWLNGRTQVNIYHPSFKKDTVELQFIEKQFTSISGLTSKKDKITYLPYVADNFGIIKGKVETNKKVFELQLIDNQYIINNSYKNVSNYSFKGISPGKYTLRVLIDDNNDGKIELGNFKTRTVPESIYFHTEVLDVKANWEFADINITF